MHRLIRAMAVATATIILAGLAATSATAGGRATQSATTSW